MVEFRDLREELLIKRPNYHKVFLTRASCFADGSRFRKDLLEWLVTYVEPVPDIDGKYIREYDRYPRKWHWISTKSTVDFYFQDIDDALLFKITWGGQ